jgi:hypothetical protein
VSEGDVEGGCRTGSVRGALVFRGALVALHHGQACYGLQNAVATYNSPDSIGGKPADANLSADLQIDQSKSGGKNLFRNHCFWT